tara:strand:- start:1023 stop:1436 length:414 start_codon:yes stop_codon:yes gene_type:complete
MQLEQTLEMYDIEKNSSENFNVGGIYELISGSYNINIPTGGIGGDLNLGNGSTNYLKKFENEVKIKEMEEYGSNFGQIPKIPSSYISPVVIPYGNLTELGGDVHDTFKIDRYDNSYGGHTSIKIPGGDNVQIDWNID